MITKRPPFVLALCGPSGAGKSTLIAALRGRAAVTSLALDEYEALSVYPKTAAWLAGGADPDAFESPQFAADLRALAAGRAVTPPGGAPRPPADLVVAEEPFGRERASVAPLLHAAVYLHVPPEVALARKLSRSSAFWPWEQDAPRHLANLRGFLGWYLGEGRAFAQAVEARARPRCDLELDGMRPTEELADALLAWVAARRST